MALLGGGKQLLPRPQRDSLLAIASGISHSRPLTLRLSKGRAGTQTNAMSSPTAAPGPGPPSASSPSPSSATLPSSTTAPSPTGSATTAPWKPLRSPRPVETTGWSPSYYPSIHRKPIQRRRVLPHDLPLSILADSGKLLLHNLPRMGPCALMVGVVVAPQQPLWARSNPK